ncbi:MAG: glycoside hydrolase family 3 C-terminal domain-containing protein [Oscillospiraceae bacterium]|jgi:beta-glucosidase|nr:glycoside hydrolase family 3 C-terminal domain-containing protein [Oscillospiraceae bacterium]
MSIPELIAKMTLEEKAGLCSGDGWWHTKAVERLGIPAITLSDGPHGVRTADANLREDGSARDAVCFPAACASASSFDTELLRREGEALGDECNAIGVAVLLGPAANIKRSPLCGRNFEYISEDPFLTGQIAAALIEGIQSKGVGTSMKHFAANNQEFCRLAVSAEVDERTLREIYLAGFEYAVKTAKPWTLMCSYNRINGLHASMNPWLLTTVLREEWGFEGFVMSDWGAVNDRVKGIEAGLDLEMPESGSFTTTEIIDAVNSGTLSETALDLTVARILKIVFEYAKNSSKRGEIEYEKHHALAAEIEENSAVLLKNDNGVLPLGKSANVVFIGSFAENPRYQGGGSSNVKSWKVTSALDAAKAAGYGVTYLDWFPTNEGYTDYTVTVHELVSKLESRETCDILEKADAIVIFAGLPDSFESEGYDRQHMQLPDAQNVMISRIAHSYSNVAVVLHNGSPIEMPWVDEVSAILELYLGGEAVGDATVRLLYGDANPSGKLAETFPKKLSDNPSYLNFPGSEQYVNYSEGLYVGYRYYDKKQMDVLFPFGHGLSYTTFSYSRLRVSSEQITDSDELEVFVDVENTGRVAGKEVVQLYVRGPESPQLLQLKGFVKLSLHPGEVKTASFKLDKRAFAYWHTESQEWLVEGGSYLIAVGSSSRDIRQYAFIACGSNTLPHWTVTENTTGLELKNDPRTFGVFIDIMVNRLKIPEEQLFSDGSGGGNAMLELPIRSFIRIFANSGDSDIIAELNAAINSNA